jgi:hypothetical protein
LPAIYGIKLSVLVPTEFEIGQQDQQVEFSAPYNQTSLEVTLYE